MATTDHADFNAFMDGVNGRNPHQPEFGHAVEKVAEDIFRITGQDRLGEDPQVASGLT
jgi:glutamate dehydrogenase (NADP+)